MMNLSEIVETVKKLVEVRIKIAVNKLADDFASIVTRVVVLILMVMTGVMVLLFGSIALAFFLAEKMASVYMGFLTVAASYLVLLLLLYLVRNSASLQTSLKSGLTKFIFLFKQKSTGR
ncbi:phage holin family protein [Lunatimonas salinarum]|uniref:phage holin family protein n=1 Tax=Lunatimonas salinarum TaxID=1774590 RepID=UPI001AE01DAD|nr:phage holin family protein [Lunatimonas salinarum]